MQGTESAREVELMADAGLVEAARTAQGTEAYAVINRVTATGYVFLRAFRNQPLAPRESLGA